MNWGMISYQVPLAIYPTTYNKKPLMFAALAAQKNNLSLYLMCIYQSPDLLHEIKAGFEQLGNKPNMGKSCIRFKKADDIPLETIGTVIRKMTLKRFLAEYERGKG